jgi:hypothetical protein
LFPRDKPSKLLILLRGGRVFAECGLTWNNTSPQGHLKHLQRLLFAGLGKCEGSFQDVKTIKFTNAPLGGVVFARVCLLGMTLCRRGHWNHLQRLQNVGFRMSRLPFRTENLGHDQCSIHIALAAHDLITFLRFTDGSRDESSLQNTVFKLLLSH